MKLAKAILLLVTMGAVASARADLELLRCTAQAGRRVARATLAFDQARRLVGQALLELVVQGGPSLSGEVGFIKMAATADGGVQFRVGDPAQRNDLALRIVAPISGAPTVSYWYTTVFNYNPLGSSPGATICTRTPVQNNRPARRAECLEKPNVCLELL